MQNFFKGKFGHGKPHSSSEELLRRFGKIFRLQNSPRKRFQITAIEEEKEKKAESIFGPGAEVEVNIKKENSCDASFPAIVIEENEDDTFIVKCLSSKNGDEAGLKITVDLFHIRPPHPPVNKKYDLLEKVDALWDFAWRPGVIVKLFVDAKYLVFFKSANENKIINQSEIRPHVEWRYGRDGGSEFDKRMEKYKRVYKLGSGSFGEVWLVMNEETNEFFAMKCIMRGQKFEKYVAREIKIQKSLCHPNVIQFKEVVLSSSYLGIVMEFAKGGDLYNEIFMDSSEKRLNENMARYYFQQLISGVFYLH